MPLLDFEEDRIEALHKWAKRVLGTPTKNLRESRRTPRQVLEAKVVLVPFDPQTLRPKMEQRVVGVTKDLSVGGLGVLSNTRLDGEVHFAEISDRTNVFLLRRVRERHIHGSVWEYGFEILDRYESLADLTH